jgi:hypothetical protein
MVEPSNDGHYIVYLTERTGAHTIGRVMKITKDTKEAVAGRGDGVRPVLYQLFPVRVTGEVYERVRVLTAAETKRTGYPVPMAEVLRRCITIGLARLEAGNAK